MKKRMLAILLIAVMAVNISACNYVPESKDKTTLENTEQSEFEKTLLIDGIETISRGNNYHLYRVVGTFELCCEVYDSDGDLVFNEITQRPLTVSEINSDLIEIQIGYGSGITGSRYYSVEREQMSEEFFYVVANHGMQIAYLSGNLNDRKLIVQNIYPLTNDCKTFELDFYPDHTPIIGAEFSDDGSTLQITYMNGQSHGTTQISLKLC